MTRGYIAAAKRGRCRREVHLVGLEALGLSATTSTLVGTLGDDVGLLVLVRTSTEVADSLTGVAGTTEEESVGTGGGTHSELVEGQAFTTASLDSMIKEILRKKRSQ